LHFQSNIVDLSIFETLRELRLKLTHPLTTESAFQAIQTIRPESRARLCALRFILGRASAAAFVSKCAAIDLGIGRLREQFPNLTILHLTVFPTLLPTLTQSVAEYFPISHAWISILWSTRFSLLHCGT
jgi:hypothetical protein